MSSDSHVPRKCWKYKDPQALVLQCWRPDDQGGSHRNLRLGHMIQGYIKSIPLKVRNRIGSYSPIHGSCARGQSRRRNPKSRVQTVSKAKSVVQRSSATLSGDKPWPLSRSFSRSAWYAWSTAIVFSLWLSTEVVTFSPRPHPYLPCFAPLSRERLSLHCSPN